MRSKPERQYVESDGRITVYPEIKGFDIETANYIEFKKWLNDKTKKKNPSLFWFVIRIMAWRFPEKHTEIQNNLSSTKKFEFELILSQMKKEFEWIGMVGYQNSIRLDGKL